MTYLNKLINLIRRIKMPLERKQRILLVLAVFIILASTAVFLLFSTGSDGQTIIDIPNTKQALGVSQNEKENKNEGSILGKLKKVIRPGSDSVDRQSETNTESDDSTESGIGGSGDTSNNDNQTQSQYPTSENDNDTVIPTNTPTSTPYPIATSTPFPTNTPAVEATPTETPTPVQNESFTFSMSPVSPFTPGANASGEVTYTENPNGYWNFSINGNFSNLLPERNYQFWLCGINCSSNSSAKFTTDSSGNASFASSAFTHNQGGDPLNRMAAWEMTSPGPIPDDPEACFMIGVNSTPCLRQHLSF